MSDLLRNAGVLANAASALRDEDSALLPGIALNSNLTVDQWMWIKAAEEDYQLILKALLFYFSGKEFVYSKDAPKDAMEKRQLDNWTRYYKLLYALINECWEPLKASRFMAFPKEQVKLHKDAEPGDLLSFLLRLQFLALAHECLLPYAEFSVSKQRQFLENFKNYPKLDDKQSRAFAASKRKFLKDYGEFYSPLMATLKTIEALARRSGKGSALSRDLNQFMYHFDLIQKTSSKGLRNRKPYNWNKGDLHVGG